MIACFSLPELPFPFSYAVSFVLSYIFYIHIQRVQFFFFSFNPNIVLVRFVIWFHVVW